MSKKLLYIGYRIDEPRLEAVTINARIYRRLAGELGWSCDVLPYRGSALSIRELVGFLRSVAAACREWPGLTIHDFFVMPGVSLLVEVFLGARRAPVRYVKTYINPPGTAQIASFEGLLRLLLNNRMVCYLVARLAGAVTYIQRLALPRFHTLSAPMRYGPEQPRRHEGPLRVGYLGHALKKKGIGWMPAIVRQVLARRPGGAVFHFSFSPLQDLPDIHEQLAGIAGCFLSGPDEPKEFFSAMDVYLLPIRHGFAASGSFNTIWEAMSCGCCVVTARLPEVPDALNANNAELVEAWGPVNYVDALVGLIDNRQRLHNKRLNAVRSYTRRYERADEEVKTQLRALYDAI